MHCFSKVEFFLIGSNLFNDEDEGRIKVQLIFTSKLTGIEATVTSSPVCSTDTSHFKDSIKNPIEGRAIFEGDLRMSVI